ncbi:MAG TPA: hypothetical protein VMY99_05190 [Nevskiaceae bacterium]|nr:hypothetical protein [Nevskiaceae bacterium]
MALAKAGFELTRSMQEADIILAHSGGCFVLPATPQALVILMGLTHWPGKSIVRAIGQKIRGDLAVHRAEGGLGPWLRKTFWNGLYLCNMPANIRMFQGRKHGAVWQLPAHNTILIRNRHDAFCTPQINELPFAAMPQVVELPGHHDDIWMHPERYVDIIKLHYG